MNVQHNRPILAITIGDPSGIGPEITVKALLHKDVYEKCRPLVVGDAHILEKAALIPGCGAAAVRAISSVGEAYFEAGTIDVLDLKNVDIKNFEYGKVSAMCGNAAFEYVVRAIELAKSGQADATITNPINKEAINLAGHHFAGHTEIYAEYTGSKDYSMMLVDGNLRVVHVSTHVSLREACDRVKKARVLKVIQIADAACKSIGITAPRIAVAGLNPHSGENGMFGREEIDEIIPAIEEVKKLGINADGPIPPDTVFSKANGGMYDIVVAMYHDQGHIPLKLLGFQYNHKKGSWNAVNGVNITLGLPIIRSSVDHGTAFDQAGTGRANESSLLHAIEYGIKLAKNR